MAEARKRRSPSTLEKEHRRVGAVAAIWRGRVEKAAMSA